MTYQPRGSMREDPAPPTHLVLASPPHPGGRDLATVLIVDDNIAARELARIMLEQRSKLRCNMLYACGAEEALVLMRERAEAGAPVDLLLLDINMPKIDGFEVLAALAEDESIPHPTVVMCSTSSSDHDIERAFALGASGYVEKPPRLDTLRPLLGPLQQFAMEDRDSGVYLVRAC